MKTELKRKNESYYGVDPSTLVERIEWIELLYQEVQVYKILVKAAAEHYTENPASLDLEIYRRKAILLNNLPELMEDRWRG